jgi:hypothetical protein
MAKNSSVGIKSTGQAIKTTFSGSTQSNGNSDDNPHSFGGKNEGSHPVTPEYREGKAAGITSHGVGNLKGNDAACGNCKGA